MSKNNSSIHAQCQHFVNVDTSSANTYGINKANKSGSPVFLPSITSAIF